MKKLLTYVFTLSLVISGAFGISLLKKEVVKAKVEGTITITESTEDSNELIISIRLVDKDKTVNSKIENEIIITDDKDVNISKNFTGLNYNFSQLKSEVNNDSVVKLVLNNEEGPFAHNVQEERISFEIINEKNVESTVSVISQGISTITYNVKFTQGADNINFASHTPTFKLINPNLDPIHRDYIVFTESIEREDFESEIPLRDLEKDVEYLSVVDITGNEYDEFKVTEAKVKRDGSYMYGISEFNVDDSNQTAQDISFTLVDEDEELSHLPNMLFIEFYSSADLYNPVHTISFDRRGHTEVIHIPIMAVYPDLVSGETYTVKIALADTGGIGIETNYLDVNITVNPLQFTKK